MKKLIYLIVVALIFGLVLTGCLLSNVGQVPTNEQSGITYLTKTNGELYTEANPFTTDLLAGQNIDVGEVQVWNDAENLYITYVIDEDDWYLTETHLHVACDKSDIPQNKKGNPIPGHFDYSSEHEIVDYVTEYLLDPIPLSSIDCCDPVIAAHAVVCKLSDVMTDTLVSGIDTQCAGFTTVDPLLDPLALLNYSPGTWSNAVDLFSPHPNWYIENTSPFGGAFWISSADSREGSNWDDQYRLFKDSFEILTGAVNLQAKLWMSADNDAIAYQDNVTNVVGEIEDVYTGSPSGNTSPFSESHYYEFTPNQGLNTLYFVVRNWGWSGNNPTGLLYKMDYEYQLLECETAWGFGTRFVVQGNWGMYFTYPVQPVLIETIDINPILSSGVNSSSTLEVGVEYEFVVTGVWQNRTFEKVDAKFCSGDNWTTATDAPGLPGGPYADTLLELQVNDEFMEWGDYDNTHTYSIDFMGLGSTVNFKIYDTYYPDNVNSTMKVEIWKKCM